MRDETLRLLSEAGISTLIVTHDPEEAMYMADRIAVMRSGRILQQGPPDEVYAAPADAFTAKFLSDVNWMHGTVVDGTAVAPVGSVAVEGIADGMRVDVLIRPEAVQIADAVSEPAVAADVVAVHPLGHSSIVVLDTEGEALRLRARLSGSAVPRPGSRVGVTFDRDQAFVFPCSGPNSLD